MPGFPGYWHLTSLYGDVFTLDTVNRYFWAELCAQNLIKESQNPMFEGFVTLLKMAQKQGKTASQRNDNA